MGAGVRARADRPDPSRSLAEAAALEAALRAGRDHCRDGACPERRWRISFRQRHRRLLRVDAGTSATLARFHLDGRARQRLAPALGRLHHDPLRPQSRARRPRRDLLAVSEDRLTYIGWPFFPTFTTPSPLPRIHPPNF